MQFTCIEKKNKSFAIEIKTSDLKSNGALTYWQEMQTILNWNIAAITLPAELEHALLFNRSI